MAHSPWGQIDYSTVYARGFKSVGTPGHGGIMVTRAFAEANLSAEAIKRGTPYGDYYCFEEDCAYAIPFWELLDAYGDKMYAHCKPDGPFGTQEGRRESLLMTLSSYYPDYLLSVGTQPDPEMYARWQQERLQDRLRAEKSADLVISAISGKDYGCQPGEVHVKTADGKRHFVTKESYDKRETPNLLSKLVVIR